MFEIVEGNEVQQLRENRPAVFHGEGAAQWLPERGHDVVDVTGRDSLLCSGGCDG